MFSVKLIVLCSTYLVTYSSCGVVPFIDPCKPNDQACILASSIKALPFIAAGVPELGLKPSDPLAIDKLQALDGDLKLELNDIKLEGPKKCKLINVERNSAENLIKIVAECPIVAYGNYEVSGKLIFLDVQGNGPFNIHTENIKLEADIKIETVERDGKKYWTIANTDIDFVPIEKVYLNFENLFNGDTAKAEPILKLLDQNWLEIITTVAKPIVNALIQKEVDNINSFISNVPTDELELA